MGRTWELSDEGELLRMPRRQGESERHDMQADRQSAVDVAAEKILQCGMRVCDLETVTLQPTLVELIPKLVLRYHFGEKVQERTGQEFARWKMGS